MKNNLFTSLIAVILFLIPITIFGQAPNLGTTANFVLFSSDGAVSNTGITHLTGKVGTNNGSSTGFGNVNGGMHDGDIISIQTTADLLTVYNEINDLTPNLFTAPLLGNGQILTPGIYEITSASTLNLNLILDAEDDPNAVFIFQIDGSFSTNANSSVELINEAQACNVFWKVEGLVDMAAGTSMKGTIIANNAGINMNTDNTLEGRALSTTGAITVDGVLAYTPVGCGSPILTGPMAPLFGEAGCYGLFSSDGPVQNSGITNIVGDVGCNVGLTTGFDPLLVTGNIHEIPDVSTANAAAHLLIAYNYLNGLSHDIELLYPAQFGGNLVLTPHTYILNGATTLTDTVYLNAQGITDAVFIIKIYGAFETSVNSKVILTNGAQAKNVFWLVNGAVDISSNSIFNGNIVSQGSINIFSGVGLNGRALSGVGALSSFAINGATDIVLGNCDMMMNSINELGREENIQIYPNPFGDITTINIADISKFNTVELVLYNSIGTEVMNINITSNSTTFDTGYLSSGIYFYKVVGNGNIIQSGKLISQ